MKHATKSKILNLLLLLSSFLGYLEWGTGSTSFLIQAEVEIISKLFNDPASVLHPFTLLPMAGQIILLLTLFQKNPGKILTFVGISGIGILLVFMFVIGLISLNFRIVGSVTPFLSVSFFTFRHHSRKELAESQSVFKRGQL